MYVVYVQDPDGNPMDPTKRYGKVRRILRDGQAKVVKRKPFTIRLNYMPKTHVTHHYMGCIDPGRTNIGTAVIRMEDAQVVYTDHIETRNKEIPKLMEKRKAHRQASRRGERLAKKRLAKAHHTMSTKLDNGRKISGCKEVINVKDIINTEARFANRKRPKGWITPTVRQLTQTHLNHVTQLCSILPITEWAFETNKFAFMRMEDGTVKGVDFQNGKMKGYKSVEDYVYALQEGKCACCGKPIDDIHHIYPRSKGGSDGPDNRVGLCEECHHKIHTGELDINLIGKQQKYGTLSVLNQAIPHILKDLIERFGEDNVHTCFGWQTKETRENMELPKEHHMDAAAIGTTVIGKEVSMKEAAHYEIKQFRKQDRALIKCQTERSYKEAYINEKGQEKYRTIAKNRKPRTEQQSLALDRWFEEQVREYGKKTAEKMRSQLKVVPSCRKYNDTKRIMPGTTFIYQNKEYVLSGTLTNGKYYRAVGDKKTNFPASKCKILTNNTGLVYL